MRKCRNVLFSFVLFVNLLRNAVVLGQEPGFISIDCGGTEVNHVDAVTGIKYVSDTETMKLGVTAMIATEYITNTSKYLQHLRSFPYGKRNCYTVGPVTSGANYLLRASFMHGNYDGFNFFPTFDFYLGVSFIKTVTGTVTKWTSVEVMFVPTDTNVSVCLLKTTSGVPFISSIELRPMNVTGYTILNSTTAMVTQQRSNFGSLNGEDFRYPDDSFDRLWNSPASPSLVSINTTERVSPINNDFTPPSVVMQTAVINSNSSRGIEWDPSNLPLNTYFYMCIHIAELQKLGANQTREFKITLNGLTFYKAQQPQYLTAVTTYSTSSYLPDIKGRNQVDLLPTAKSTLSPILNAAELFLVRSMSSSLTDSKDVIALTNIKNDLKLNNNWTGDPCLPQGYTWEKLGCSNDSSPRVTSLDLSYSGLSGEIPGSLSQLAAIVSLNLAGNNLTGLVPSFLAELAQLNYLNLSDNNFSGSIPDALLRRNQSGSLLLSVSGNKDICLSSSCNKSNGKKNKSVVVGVVVAVVVVLIVAAFIAVWIVLKSPSKQHMRTEPKVRRKPNDVKVLGKTTGCKAFTHSELKTITNNFSRKIGEGGYGPVFHGSLPDGQDVAVKILSHKSKQGSKEFYTEVSLLSRVHHKNLVSFFGYCDEAENMILVYEYIPGGNLQNILSDSFWVTIKIKENLEGQPIEFLEAGRSQIMLDWDQRLQVAFNAAQGLDYLHSGCKPAIIHRDIKSANILLNERLEAKIADFGMSKSDMPEGATHISTVVVGTYGYLDPEYYLTNRINEKSDVYSFGVVLLELITGRQPIIAETSGERVHIANWVRPQLLKGDLASIADPRFQRRYDVGSMWRVAETALECLATQAANRPSMSKVASNLKEVIESCNTSYATSGVLRSGFTPSSGTSTGIYKSGSTVDEDFRDSVIYEAPPAR